MGLRDNLLSVGVTNSLYGRRACHRPIGETESVLLDRRLYTADPTQIKFGIDVHMVD